MTWKEIAAHVIKEFEGCELLAYPDPATGGEPFTIGWGSTGPDIKKGTVWTQARADLELNKHIESIGKYIDTTVLQTLTDHQKGALVSFVYNLGRGTFSKSTLLKLLNKGEMTEAAEQFERFVKANGKVMKGLVRRRAYERYVFLGNAVS